MFARPMFADAVLAALVHSWCSSRHAQKRSCLCCWLTVWLPAGACVPCRQARGPGGKAYTNPQPLLRVPTLTVISIPRADLAEAPGRYNVTITAATQQVGALTAALQTCSRLRLPLCVSIQC